MIQKILDWTIEKGLDALSRGIGKAVKKINFEKVILAFTILFFVFGSGLLIFDNVVSSNNIWVEFYRSPSEIDLSPENMITDSETNSNQSNNRESLDVISEGTEGNYAYNKEQIYYKWSIYTFFGIVSVTISVLLLVSYILLRVEKRNNRAVFRDKKREIKRLSIKQANEMLKIKQEFERVHLLPETWKCPDTGSITEKEKQTILGAYESMEKQILQAYEKICLHIVSYAFPHISEINPTDSLHVSVKAISKNADGETIVISLGYAHQDSNDSPPKTKVITFKRWSDRVKESYLLKDDYVLSRVCNDDTDFGVFACGDLKEFATQQDGEADRFGRFRKPDHNDREYNATIVCPIYYVENSKIHITGAICIDTTSSYKEWNNSGSYEEEIITFVSSNIGPLLKHNIDEFNLAEKIIRKVS